MRKSGFFCAILAFLAIADVAAEQCKVLSMTISECDHTKTQDFSENTNTDEFCPNP